MNTLRKSILVLAALSVSITVNAGTIKVWGEAPYNGKNQINSFYDSLADHNSTLVAGQLDTIDLSDTDLFWAVQPGDDYTSLELDAMSDYLSLGGRIAFMGEHGTITPDENNRINTALAFLGSTISINNVVLDGGFRQASISDGQILTNPLTTGVDTYEYAAFAPLTVGTGADSLMLGEELFNGEPSVMMAFQNIGAGSIFLITDQNVFDNWNTNWGGNFDNGRMFENLVSASTGAPPVETSSPSILALFALSIFGLIRLPKKS